MSLIPAASVHSGEKHDHHTRKRLLLRPCAVLLGATLVGCTHGAVDPPAQAGVMVVQGLVTAVDRSPMAYDGNGLMTLETDSHGEVTVQVPARTNLCKAQGLDVFFEVEPGVRVEAAGEANGAAELTVCMEPAHYLRRAD